MITQLTRHESSITPLADFLLDTAVEFLLWSNIEEVLGITCANIPLIVTYISSHNQTATRSSKTHRIMSRRPTGAAGVYPPASASDASIRNIYVPLQNCKPSKDVERSSRTLVLERNICASRVQAGDYIKRTGLEEQGIKVETDIEQRIEAFHQV